MYVLGTKVQIEDLMDNIVEGVIIGIDNTPTTALKYLINFDRPCVMTDSQGDTRCTTHKPYTADTTLLETKDIDVRNCLWLDEQDFISSKPTSSHFSHCGYYMDEPVILDVFSDDYNKIGEAYGYIVGVDLDSTNGPQVLIGFPSRLKGNILRKHEQDIGDETLDIPKSLDVIGVRDKEIIYSSQLEKHVTYIWVGIEDIKESVGDRIC